ncbi:MAG TPA: FKBP-type peptidyl-prolyl cis-trans isomerase [Candidatus Dormibacteraeota bacterium]|nr:FKBP-type peptidyl-prolyl cis-trans isomerase [Candidatus Dormibacteraeota bacterium]
MRSRALIPAAVAALAALVAGCGYPDPNVNSGPAATVSETTPTPQAGADDYHEGDGKPAVKFPDGLQFVDLKAGDGQVVPAGATVRVQYTGWLSGGKMFDTSRQAGRDTLCAILVNTQSTNGDCTPVIPGWNEGVPGMKVGGKRKLIIPPSLAYGDQGAPPTIPANATLTFSIELVSIVTTATPPPDTPSPSPT